jgi:amidase
LYTKRAVFQPRFVAVKLSSPSRRRFGSPAAVAYGPGMLDPYDALLPVDVAMPPSGVGALNGRSFVVKDVIDVAGSVTGAGSPALRASRPAASRSAPVVEALLRAGARCVGKARSDELAFSLVGLNERDGTPRNPRAPGHVTGGSSSGSAAAVAGGLADIGLGTDTAGSIRVPASYCGLVGIRPTHGRVAADGLVPLAPGFDTVGWLTADGALARAVGRVLLQAHAEAPPPAALAVAVDLLPDDEAAVVTAAAERWAAALGVPLSVVVLGDADRWAHAFHLLRAAEAWEVHGGWLDRDHPDITPAVERRLRAGASVPPDDRAAARLDRDELLRRLDEVTPRNGALVVPASAGRAPALTAPEHVLEDVRRRTLRITSVASLAGVPSVAVPAAAPGLPYGVALVGRAGDDESLLAAAEIYGSERAR